MARRLTEPGCERDQRTLSHLSRGGGNRSVSMDKSLFASFFSEKEEAFHGRRSTDWAREDPGSNASPKYCVS
jgi:hypothetical protein